MTCTLLEPVISNISSVDQWEKLIWLAAIAHYIGSQWVHYDHTLPKSLNISSPPSAAYMRQWIGSGLVQIMARRLFGANSLSEPVPEFVTNGPINNIPALVQIMAWRPPGDKPLSEPMMAS